jgi:hypothetical protein
MVCFRYIIVNILHEDYNKYDDDDDDDDDDDNNNNNNNNNNTSFSLGTDIFSLILLLLNQQRSPTRFRLQVSDSSTFYNTCDVLNRAVF